MTRAHARAYVCLCTSPHKKRIMYQLEDITVPRRSKSGFFVFSHARVRPLRNKRRNPASMKLAGSFVRPDLSLDGRWY